MISDPVPAPPRELREVLLDLTEAFSDPISYCDQHGRPDIADPNWLVRKLAAAKEAAVGGAAVPPPRSELDALIADFEEAARDPVKRQHGVCWTCGVDHDNEARLNRAVLVLTLRRLKALRELVRARPGRLEDKDAEIRRRVDSGGGSRGTYAAGSGEEGVVGTECVARDSEGDGHHMRGGHSGEAVAGAGPIPARPEDVLPGEDELARRYAIREEQTVANALEATEAARVALQQEIDQWKTWGIIEIAVRNPNVSSYMAHWEGRALKAEAEVAALRARVQALVVKWRVRQEGWIPTDRAIGIEQCTDELAAALARVPEE